MSHIRNSTTSHHDLGLHHTRYKACRKCVLGQLTKKIWNVSPKMPAYTKPGKGRMLRQQLSLDGSSALALTRKKLRQQLATATLCSRQTQLSPVLAPFTKHAAPNEGLSRDHRNATNDTCTSTTGIFHSTIYSSSEVNNPDLVAKLLGPASKSNYACKSIPTVCLYHTQNQ